MNNKPIKRLFDLIKQMSEKEQLALLKKLEKGPSRREHNRESYYTVIDYSIDDHFYKDILHDISESGIFIETKTNFSVGKEVSMIIPNPKERHFLKIKGTIVRSTSNGIGVRFIKLNGNKEALKSLMERLQN